MTSARPQIRETHGASWAASPPKTGSGLQPALRAQRLGVLRHDDPHPVGHELERELQSVDPRHSSPVIGGYEEGTCGFVLDPNRMWDPRVVTNSRRQNLPGGIGAGRAAWRVAGPTAETSPSRWTNPDEDGISDRGLMAPGTVGRNSTSGGPYRDPRGCVPDLADLVRS